MRALTFATIVAAMAVTGCGGANEVPLAKVNRAVLQKTDPIWQHAWFEVARIPLSSATSLPEIRRGDPSLKAIALTFDDGPHGPNTLRLLDILKHKNVRATFFVVGKMAKRHPELVRAIAKAGMEIGNHTFSHVTLTHISEEEARADYQACNDIIESLTGQRPHLCRPPGGDSDRNVIKAGASLGMTSVMWTTDPGDYDLPGTDAIHDRTFAELKTGGILLLHDGIAEMLDILPSIIDEIRARGFKIVTAGELIDLTAKTRQKMREAALQKPAKVVPTYAMSRIAR